MHEALLLVQYQAQHDQHSRKCNKHDSSDNIQYILVW